jgi:hypothetical protein
MDNPFDLGETSSLVIETLSLWQAFSADSIAQF